MASDAGVKSAEVRLFVGGILPLPQTGRPSGIYKQPVGGPVELGATGFSGDQQADLRVHGGPDKAVHLYPSAHYARLAEAFPDLAPQLVPGGLGENIATFDLVEADVRIGDVWRLGDACLQVCQPRNPCWKIDEKLGEEGVAVFIDKHMLCGWYWRVLTSGRVLPGDKLVWESSPPDAMTLHEAMSLVREHRPAVDRLERLIAAEGIADSWRAKVVQRLEWLKRG
jgi:MOSC domain-containing protein YiiM